MSVRNVSSPAGGRSAVRRTHMPIIFTVLAWLWILTHPGHLAAAPPRDVDVLYQYEEALEHLEEGRTEEAVSLLEAAIEVRPEPERGALLGGSFRLDYYPYYHLGKAYRAVGRYDDALEMLKASVAKGELARDRSRQAERLAAIDQLELLGGIVFDLQEGLSFPEGVPRDFQRVQELTINGVPTAIAQVDEKAGRVRFLGSETNPLKQGINTFRVAAKTVRFWLEEKKLTPFETPYTNSHAVIVAVGDYSRTHDPERRGRTPFEPVPGMVERARELAEKLVSVGFPRKGITTLFDEEATSTAVRETLRRFWKGGDLEATDRLFFYFGGHGDTSGEVPFLVTYDFDPRKPTLTSLPMRELTVLAAEAIVARQMLITLDACHAGLGGPKTLDRSLEEERLQEFRTLTLVRRDAGEKGRNVLVAGTGEQRALYENGGIFTEALIEALGGSADQNADGLVQFEELALHVRNRVTQRAAETGFRQDPDYYSLGRGQGKVLFLLERR